MGWNSADYQTVADAVFAKMDKANGTAAVIAFGQDGSIPSYKQYAASADTSSAYDLVVNAPGSYWWVGLYDTVKSMDPSGRVDTTPLAISAPPEAKTVTKEKKVGTGWGIVAGFFGGLLLIAAGTKKRRG